MELGRGERLPGSFDGDVRVGEEAEAILHGEDGAHRVIDGLHGDEAATEGFGEVIAVVFAGHLHIDAGVEGADGCVERVGGVAVVVRSWTEYSR